MNLKKGISPLVIGCSIAALVLIVGCGGGGGSSSTGTTTATATSTATTSTATTSTATTSTATTSTATTSTGGTFGISTAEHVAANGDNYNYTVTTVSQVTNGGTPVTGTGLRSESILSTTVNGSTLFSHQISDGYTLGSGTAAFFDSYFFTQDSGANILFTGDAKGTSNTERTANTAIQFYPGTWTISIGESGTTALSPSGSTTYSLVNQGQGTVTIPLGTFTCWKVQITKTVDTVTRTGVYYYDPKIGNYVSGDETITDTTANTVTTLHLQLSSTNVLPLG